MGDLTTWLLVEYAAIGVLGLAALIQRMRERAAWRRLATRAFTRAPMSTTAPTVAELRAPDWTRPDPPA